MDVIIIAASKNKELIEITQNAVNGCYESGERKIYIVETYKEYNYKHAKVLPFIRKEFNYNRCINFAVNKTKSDIIGVFNNDVEFTDGWNKPIYKALKKYDSVSPRCKYSNKQSTGLREGYRLRVHINGWALIFKRSVFDKIGKFDTHVKFWRSDDVYSDQIKAANIKHALVSDSIVNHLENGSNTLKTLDKKEKERLTTEQYSNYKDLTFSDIEFSIIMPSYLGNYDNAAANREMKIKRAIESVKNQSFKNWELIIVADGCNKTVEIVKPYLSDKIKCFKIGKQAKFAGNVRQIGIDRAIGKYIIYLDNDDMYHRDHLKYVHNNYGHNDWVYFDDIFYNGPQNYSYKKVKLELGSAGTSSISHKRLLKTSWNGCDGYGHDFRFIEKLMDFTNYKHIGKSGYLICHVPGSFDYDGNS